MGGHALSEGLTERKQLADYVRIKQAVLDKFQEVAHGIIRVCSITEMPGKESFGDLDLLYIRETGISLGDVKELIVKHFTPTEIVTTSHVTSFDFERFQIDMIACDEDTYEMSNFCLSYGDRGMILGQIARWQGFSLGSLGLCITAPDVEKIVGIPGVTEKITLTVNPNEVRAYMGVPLQDTSLLTPDDVAVFCKRSRWFQPEQFTRKFNSENRKRWANRPFYRSFVESVIAEFGYGDEDGVQAVKGDSSEFVRPVSTNKTCPHVTDEAHHAIRRANIEEALTHFHKWDEIESIRGKYEARRELKEKLNYRHFLDLDLSTRDLHRARGSFASWLEDQKKKLKKQKQDEGREQSECGAVVREEQGGRDNTVYTFATSTTTTIGDTTTTGDTTTATTIGEMDGDGTGDGDIGSGQIIISTATTPTTGVSGASGSTEDVLASLLRDMTVEEVQMELEQWHRTVWTATTCCQTTTTIHEIASHLNTL